MLRHQQEAKQEKVQTPPVSFPPWNDALGTVRWINVDVDVDVDVGVISLLRESRNKRFQ